MTRGGSSRSILSLLLLYYYHYYVVAQHYDWGLRALKTVLRVGGQLVASHKRAKGGGELDQAQEEQARHLPHMVTFLIWQPELDQAQEEQARHLPHMEVADPPHVFTFLIWQPS